MAMKMADYTFTRTGPCRGSVPHIITRAQMYIHVMCTYIKHLCIPCADDECSWSGKLRVGGVIVVSMWHRAGGRSNEGRSNTRLFSCTSSSPHSIALPAGYVASVAHLSPNQHSAAAAGGRCNLNEIWMINGGNGAAEAAGHTVSHTPTQTLSLRCTALMNELAN